jgi:adenine-specific DNA-methyltransferase
MAHSRKRIGLARSLRKQAVPAEALLWKALRNRALGGFKFRRQRPIGPYIVDFACVECKLAIELDGLSHLRQNKAHEDRAAFLENAGWCFMRFWNTVVYDDFESVREAIYRQCVARVEVG